MGGSKDTLCKREQVFRCGGPPDDDASAAASGLAEYIDELCALDAFQLARSYD